MFTRNKVRYASRVTVFRKQSRTKLNRNESEAELDWWGLVGTGNGHNFRYCLKVTLQRLDFTIFV